MLSDTYWHRDFGRGSQGAQWNFPYDHPTLSEDVKLFLNVFDTTPEQGCTAVVPRTHRLLGKPGEEPGREDTGMQFAGGVNSGLGLDAMPGAMRLAGKAGDAMLADIRTWHTAMENTTDTPRESLILMFSPFWRKGGLEASGKRVEERTGEKLNPGYAILPNTMNFALKMIGFILKMMERITKNLRRLRQMLGIEEESGGNIYDPEYAAAHPRPDLM